MDSSNFFVRSRRNRYFVIQMRGQKNSSNTTGYDLDVLQRRAVTRVGPQRSSTPVRGAILKPNT